MAQPFQVQVEQAGEDFVDVLIEGARVRLPKASVAGSPKNGGTISLVGFALDDQGRLPQELARSVLNDILTPPTSSA